MGASQEIIVYTHKMRTFLAITLAIACFMASANQDVDEDFGPIMELVDMSPEGDLMTTLGDMQKVAPTHMHFHINRIAKHAVLLQMDKKAAAYTHNFDASKAAIMAALKALTNQWNINPANLTPCNSNAELTNEFGPANWLPTSGRCSKAWHEASGKLIFEL